MFESDCGAGGGAAVHSPSSRQRRAPPSLLDHGGLGAGGAAVSDCASPVASDAEGGVGGGGGGGGGSAATLLRRASAGASDVSSAFGAAALRQLSRSRSGRSMLGVGSPAGANADAAHAPTHQHGAPYMHPYALDAGPDAEGSGLGTPGGGRR
eukprot:333777-Chlamydomonas_euryale.AAC.1